MFSDQNPGDTSAGLPSPVDSLGALQDESLSRNSSVQRKYSQESIQSPTGLNPTTPVHGRTSNLRTGPAATMQTSRSGLLPSIAGSPVVQSKSKAASPSPSTRRTQARTLSSATPTKIPRMASRTSLVNSIGLPGPSAPMPTKSGTAYSLPVSRERTVTGPAAVSGSMLAELGYGTVDKSRVGTRLLAKNGTMDLPRTDQSPTSVSSQTTIIASGKPAETQKRDLPLPPDDAVPASTNRTNKALPRDLSAGSLRRTSLTGPNTGNGASPAATPSKTDRIPSRLAVPGYARIPHSSSASNLSGRSSRSQSPQTSVLDEDEMKGNDEMASFFRRQKAKQARGEIKSTEIEAMLNFPDPMAPGNELSPHGKYSWRALHRNLLAYHRGPTSCSIYQNTF
jgi:dual specificity tyrosine-phosphorylation-regulated kinase 2/3/4